MKGQSLDREIRLNRRIATSSYPSIGVERSAAEAVASELINGCDGGKSLITNWLLMRRRRVSNYHDDEHDESGDDEDDDADDDERIRSLSHCADYG